MSTAEFLRQLRLRDVRVWTDGAGLRVNAPRGALTAELQAELTTRRSEILNFLDTASRWRSTLVPIQPSGSRPAFFGVPGPDGDVFCYVRLARELGPDQPFYAFEPPGLDGVEAPVTTIEGLVARYLADLKTLQPRGPYLIGGFCLGGIVAFELARQLRAAGDDVALLALFESPSPNGLRPRNRAAAARRCRRNAIVDRVRWLLGQPWSQRVAFVRGRLVRAVRRLEPAATRRPALGWWEEQKARVARATFAAAYAYALEARPYPGRIVLFLASERSKRRAYGRQLDWAHVAAGGLEAHVGPDCPDHVTMLVEPAYVRFFGGLLRRCIDAPARVSTNAPSAA